jgi:ubiquinone/menaquinone biosynthesis C-methylase UbiE
MHPRELGEYILGTDGDELRRLQFQHVVWLQDLFWLMRRASLAEGDAVLDLGCGPGFTSVELARVVGSRGRVVACDTSRRFLAFLEGESKRLGLEQIECLVGDVSALAVQEASVDLAYARWLLCWLPDVTPVLRRVFAALRPGGVLAVHDYLDWGGMALLPNSPIFRQSVEAILASWQRNGIAIDVARDLPERARAVGFEVELIEPIARIGAVGSLEWRWVGEFFHSYLSRLVAQSALLPGAYAAFVEEWRRRESSGDGYLVAPTMAALLLRKPRT